MIYVYKHVGSVLNLLGKHILCINIHIVVAVHPFVHPQYQKHRYQLNIDFILWKMCYFDIITLDL